MLALLSRCVILVFGTLYPAYASYKAVRTKDVKEYVKWMMYWIVFAFFTCIETFTDIFLSWFPFYYEIKVILVIWLLSPATKGSSTLYRKFVHPMLTKREQEIDEYINQAKEKGYTAVLQLGSKATTAIMQTAIKGGGGLVQTIRKSYSLSDLSEPEQPRSKDDIDATVRLSQQQQQRMLRSQTRNNPMRGRPNVEMSFPELDLQMKRSMGDQGVDYDYIRSSDNISSGYSSAEPGLSRAGSISSTTKTRLRSKNRSEFPDDLISDYDETPQILSEDEDEVQLRQRSFEQREFLPQDLEKYQLFLKWLENEKNREKSEELSMKIETKPLETIKEVPRRVDSPELTVPESPHRRSVSPIEQRLETVEQELKAFTLKPQEDEFLDVIDDDDDRSITISEPTASTVIENPDWTAQMLEKIETLADGLTKSSLLEPEIDSMVTVEPKNIEKSKNLDDINLPKDIQIGPKVIHLDAEEEGTSSDNPASDEEIVIESKLTISNSQIALTTLKTSSSQNSLNKIGSRRSSLTGSQSNLAKASSLTNVSDQKPFEKPTLISHGKGKAPVPPPLQAKSSTNPDAGKPPMRPAPSDRLNKEKKRRSGGGLFSSFTGIFKSDHTKDDSHEDGPRETRI
ncbi:uncharacterized protein LOC134836938 [Culicoides brevitarsis]|uniref:uncharacterized protein LOC134836938 n=1 Tax=Culicoides brevitarsis TaxID=469753 RepID=UPI00307C3C41